jgi:hypothetical protein
MVTCKLFAQAGNQAFMVSAAIAHALHMDTKYAFQRRTTAPQIWRTYFTHLPVMPANQSTKHFYKEPGPAFSPIPHEQDITIEGYFQSERYMYEHKQQIAEILGFQYQPADYVAVHVRRGDYLKYPDRFPVLDLSYYRSAMELMGSYDFFKFKIYSDDIAWCKKTINYNMPINKMAFDSFLDISYSENRDPVSDMKDMYNASAFIIANSTFSLYPALLRVDNPLVIAPAGDRWFGPAAKHLNSPDRMPERFIKI